jgi:hypothetical protein
MLADENTLPSNISIYNPSKSKNWLYIRKTELNITGEINSIIMKHSAGSIVNIQSPYDLLAKTVNLFRGLEDLRICEFEDRVWFSAACTHISENMDNELVIGLFNKDVNGIERVQMVDIGSKPVKNVIPFVFNNTLLLLDIYLNKIYEIKTEEETGKWYVTVYKTLQPAAGVSTEKYRGSSAPIHINGTIFGCVAHDIIFNDNNSLVTRLSYIHHWIEFDIATGLITFISTPFWIYHWGIEYVSGIEKTDKGINLYLGIRDKTCMRVETTLSNLRIGK